MKGAIDGCCRHGRRVRRRVPNVGWVVLSRDDLHDILSIIALNLLYFLNLVLHRADSSIVEEFRSGKEKVIGYLVGQVMRKSKGKADPKVTIELLKKSLR